MRKLRAVRCCTPLETPCLLSSEATTPTRAVLPAFKHFTRRKILTSARAVWTGSQRVPIIATITWVAITALVARGICFIPTKEPAPPFPPFSAMQWAGSDPQIWSSDQSWLPRAISWDEPVPLPDPAGGGVPAGAGVPGALRRGGPPGCFLPLRHSKGIIACSISTCSVHYCLQWNRKSQHGCHLAYKLPQIQTEMREYGPFCGSTPPARIKTGTHQVHVVFRADATGRNKGWKIRYTSTATPCPYPVPPPHGRIQPRQTLYMFTDSFNVTCKRGYKLFQGTKNLTSYQAVCQSDGTWNSSMPECHPVDCGQPEGIPLGEVSVTTTTYQSSIQYTCAPSFNLRGSQNGTYFCTQDGYWRNSLGSLVLPECGPCP
ncbi:mannan-binding lectin serine protease 2 isoform X2 [Paramormyrops kingsleyae]|uniref:mannan-binding lectin serine protease 2 isoform X2 n=1 Tax=Paramormyrops kingsleyae TaxID=1676925 RepID=UPI003B97341F